VALIVVLVGADWLLGMFGAAYAREAATPLRLLVCGVFPASIKSHFIAIGRVRGRVRPMAWILSAGALLQIALAIAGGALDGLSGLAEGWLIGMLLEAMVLAPTVVRATRGIASAASPR
jgi:O-antigen/teichoic acid export membrane protein